MRGAKREGKRARGASFPIWQLPVFLRQTASALRSGPNELACKLCLGCSQKYLNASTELLSPPDITGGGMAISTFRSQQLTL